MTSSVAVLLLLSLEFSISGTEADRRSNDAVLLWLTCRELKCKGDGGNIVTY